jgi:NAD(P)H-dependent FMN reductase
MRILAISGSLQAQSSNTALLGVAKDIAPADVDVSVYEGVASLPHFNPDLDREPALPAVSSLRREVRRADAVLIATPEYAHAMPGALKDALDWLVGTGELYGKRVAVLSASPRPDGAVRGRRNLEATLRAQGAQVVSSSTIQLVRTDVERGLTKSREIRASVADTLAILRSGSDET